MAMPILPKELQEDYDTKAREFSICIHTQEYEEALAVIKGLYDRMLTWQDQYRTRFHKGYPIHNTGYTLYLQNKPKEAVKYFILAYIEDLISADAEDEADSTAAGKTLLSGYGFNPEELTLLKQKVAEFKGKSEIPFKPEEVIRGFGKAEESYYEDIPGKITVIPKHRRLRTFAKFDSDWRTRVFIGGSGALAFIIESMRAVVEGLGYDPVVAVDFDMPDGMTIYHKCLLLLHSCRYAIFDLSEQAGQLLEIERAPEYGVETLIVCPKGKEASTTQMVTSVLKYRVVKYKSYTNDGERDDHIRSFLS